MPITRSLYNEILEAAGVRADSVARVLRDVEIVEDVDASPTSSEGSGSPTPEGESAEQNAATEGEVSP